MLTILLFWAFLTLTVLSFGYILISFWNKITKRDEVYSFTDSFWLGLASIGSILCLASLFVPLSIYILIGITCISICYWICYRRKLSVIGKEIYRSFKELSLLSKIFLSVLFLLICAYSLSIPTGYDIGLYHLQSMMWNGEYSVVPGLGNLHSRLAFNSNSLLLYTVFFHHPDYFIPNFSINGLCIFILSFWVIKRADEKSNLLKTFSLYFFLLVFYFAFVQNLSSSSTDLFVNMIVAYLLFRSVMNENSHKKDYLIYLFIPIFCITLKISSIFIGLISLVPLFYLFKEKGYRSLILFSLVAIFAIIPWIVRFVIMSGYLIYPFPAIDIFDFDWKIPIAKVIEEKESISTWAKTYLIDQKIVSEMPIYKWVPIWFENLSKLYAISYILALLSPVLVFFSRSRRKSNETPYLIAWGVAYIGFFTAPDPRFSLCFILCCVCIPLFYLASVPFNRLRTIPYIRYSIIGTNIMFIFIFSLGLINSFKKIKDYQDKEVPIYTLIYKPQPFYYVSKILNIEFESYSINKTLFYTPKLGDQCYEKCLPCAPNFMNNLEMRGESLQDGFKIRCSNND